MWRIVSWWFPIVIGSSLVGIGLILFSDWLIYRRIPFARWRSSQLPLNERNILREVTRLRRLKHGPPDRGGAQDEHNPTGPVD